MRFDVPKKAFLALGGVVTSSVGSWKLYEEADPSIDTLLNRQGFHYRPIEADLEAEGVLSVPDSSTQNAKFNFIPGEAIKRLLPNLEAISDDEDNTAGLELTLDENFYKDFGASEASFIVDIKHWNHDNKQKNAGIVVKMELVVKNKSGNKGFVIQNIISNLVGQRSFLDRYRYFLVEKDSGSWKVKEGLASADSKIFSGSQTIEKFVFSGLSGFNLEISQSNFCTRASGKENQCTDFKGRTANSYRYSAIWLADASSNQSLFEPIKVIARGTEDEVGSVWGIKKADESFAFDLTYKNKKWSTLAYKTEDGDKAEKFFNAFLEEKNRKGKWMLLEDFCNSWSSGRDRNDPNRWRDYCYKK